MTYKTLPHFFLENIYYMFILLIFQTGLPTYWTCNHLWDTHPQISNQGMDVFLVSNIDGVVGVPKSTSYAQFRTDKCWMFLLLGEDIGTLWVPRGAHRLQWLHTCRIFRSHCNTVQHRGETLLWDPIHPTWCDHVSLILEIVVHHHKLQSALYERELYNFFGLLKVCRK